MAAHEQSWSCRTARDVIWSEVGLVLSAVATVLASPLRPFSLVLFPVVAGYVLGLFRPPHRILVSAVVAGAVFAAVLALVAWNNTGCSGECNDTTGNARLRVLVAVIATTTLVVAWSVGATLGRRASRVKAMSNT